MQQAYNVSFHKRKDTLEAIEQAGHTLRFLPTYSPDLNPIEHRWAKLKRVRRTTQLSIKKLSGLTRKDEIRGKTERETGVYLTVNEDFE